MPPRFTSGVLREGDTLELNGTGNFTFGYFGGVTLAPGGLSRTRAGVDAATGLLYVGNGQYGIYPDWRSRVEGILLQADS